MTRLQKLKSSLAIVISSMQGLNDVALSEEREFIADEQEKYSGFEAEKTSLKNQITMAENQEKLNAEAVKPTSQPVHMQQAPAVVSMKDNQVLDETGFESLADVMVAVAGGTDSRLNKISSVQQAGTGSTGGYGIPEQFVNEIMTAFVPEDPLVRPRAMVIPGGGAQPDAKIGYPALDQSGDKGVYSGVVTKWLEEGGTIQKTDFSMRKIDLEPRALAAYMPFSNKLLNNAPQTSMLGQMLMRQAVMKSHDDAFLFGDGVGKPLGFANENNTASINVNRDTAVRIKYVDLLNMIQSVKGTKLEWTVSQNAIAELSGITSPAGDYVFKPAQQGVPASMFGFPIRWSERVPLLGQRADVMLTDLSYYYIKDGSGLRLEASSSYQFLEDQTVFKIVSNVDGQSGINSPLKLENGQTVSPFVILDVPAV